MNRYLALSGGLHALAVLALLLILAPAAKKVSATYTIDFIGSGKVIATTGQETAPASEKQVVNPEVASPKEVAPAKNQKAYDAKTEIAAKPKPKKKPAAKPVALAAPSVLDEEESESSGQDVAFNGGNIQTDFADFPYPWYITQVRNSLWIEWEKRRPAGETLRAMVTFAIARDGKIRDLKVEQKSGDDAFDFAASSAVINAGPFAPLPMYYEKDELTVTVEFKQEK